MNKVTFKIIDMHCTSCALTIDGDLEDTEGVREARTSYAKGKVDVEFDPKKITQGKILEIIKKTGYTAKVT